jgi:hypothetical protein
MASWLYFFISGIKRTLLQDKVLNLVWQLITVVKFYLLYSNAQPDDYLRTTKICPSTYRFVLKYQNSSFVWRIQ